ncbi:hypothetical protein [Microbacterium sp. Marseille-Q6965]|uniref:hypothetical protein n=1 Tax=Microbacterium sp. Marseille-Q6965 TaxID=2965072 RepID=UPI0021B7295C|nr:hypothetical protein [Microbacterium sp. Marseille-Q6965]
MLVSGGYTLVGLGLWGLITSMGTIVGDLGGRGSWLLVYNLAACAVGAWMIRRGSSRPGPPRPVDDDHG